MGSGSKRISPEAVSALSSVLDPSGRVKLPAPNGGERRPWDEQTGLVGGSPVSIPAYGDASAPQANPILGDLEKLKPPRTGGDVAGPTIDRAERPNFIKELGKLSEPPKRNVLQSILEALPAAAAYASGDTALGARLSAANMARGKDQTDRQRDYRLQGLKWQQEDWARQQAADLSASKPTVINNNMVRFNPATNSASSVYQAPTDGEVYASSQGFKPGTPQWNQALQDDKLRANGPTAYGYDVQLDDHRTGNRQSLEATRFRNQSGLEGVRQGNRMTLRGAPTYRDLNGAPPRASAAAGAPRAVTATNPQTGEKMMYVNGKWVPAR